MPPYVISFAKKSTSDRSTAMEQLFGLFPDNYPVLLNEDAEYWFFELSARLDPHWYVDPDVASVARELYNIDLDEVPLFYEEEDWQGVAFVFSMFHSHAIIAASKSISHRRGAGFSHIVHVDDHTDLMPPLLDVAEGRLQLYDPLFGQYVNIGESTTVKSAIERGVINKGNFLATYLISAPSTEIIHVGKGLRDQEIDLSASRTYFELAGQRYPRTELISGSSKGYQWKLKQSEVIPDHLRRDNNLAVWLDLDLDAFCNRYNGDSDRKTLLATDEEREQTTNSIDQFLINLSTVSWLSSIHAVSVAVSPGFFPSHYWEYAIKRIHSGLKELIYQT